MIRILVADDQNLIRHALQICLEKEDDIEVVGSASDGNMAIEQIEKLHPDVALIDIKMPGMDGLNTTRIICQQFPETKVLVLSSHDEEFYINQALTMGARGYILKDTAAEDLANVIRSVNKGYFQLSPGLSEKLLTKFEAVNNFTEVVNKLEARLEAIKIETRQIVDGKLEENRSHVFTEMVARIEQLQNKLQQEVTGLIEDLQGTGINENLLEQQKGVKAQVITIRNSQKRLEKKVEWLQSLVFVGLGIGAVLAIILFFNHGRVDYIPQ